MSQPPPTPPNPVRSPTSPRRRRQPFESFVMAICGMILLAPGLCAILFARTYGAAGPLPVLWVICFLISACGIGLIVNAFRAPSR